jgi:hypothetical protein
MRPSFSRVLRAVPASAAVSGSIFASVWLLAINQEHSQVPQAAAGTSSTVVRASLPSTRTTVEHRPVLARAGAPSLATANARSHPSSLRARAALRAVPRQVAPGSGAHAPAPTSSAGASPAPAPTPAPPLAPAAAAAQSEGPAASESAVVSSRRKSAAAPKGDKGSRPTQRVTSVRANTSKPSGGKKAEPGQSDKQAAGTQTTDTKQADSKQADSKQATGKQDQGGGNSAQSDSKQSTGKNKR